MIDVAVVQFKPRKGDVAANLAAVRAIFAQLAAAGAPQLVVFPEAALTGYYLEGAVYDLARPATDVAADMNALWRSVSDAPLDVVVGFYEKSDGQFYNSALAARLGGEDAVIEHVHRKMFLPTYGVFDEERFHARGRHLGVYAGAFGPTAILICEDAWHSVMPTVAALKGARLLIVPSASPGRGLNGPDELQSVSRWMQLLTNHAAEHGVYVVYAALTGFEGGKGMSGSSCVISPRGEIIVAAPALDACILRALLDPAEVEIARATMPLLADLRSVLADVWLDPELPLPRRVPASE